MWWWLAQSLVVASGLSLLALAASGLRRWGKVSPALEHTLWTLVLVKLIMPPWLQWPESLTARLAELRSPVEAAAVRTAAQSPIAAQPQQAFAEVAATPMEEPFSLSAAAGTNAEFTPGASEALGETLARAETAAPSIGIFSAIPPPNVSARFRGWNWGLSVGPLLVAWALGGLVMAGAQVRRINGLRRLAASSVAAPPELAQEVQRLAASLGVRPPRVRTIDGLGSPLVWCWGRPILLWPAGLTGAADLRRLQGVIVHELAHLKRRDNWTGWLELAVGCLWWWCPLVWFARRRLRAAAELACDAWVLWALPGERRLYAASLVEISEHVCRQAWATPALGAVGGARHTLERRLVMILRETCPRTLSWGGLGLALAAALLAAPGWTTGQGTKQSTGGAAAAGGAPTLETSTGSPPTGAPATDAELSGLNLDELLGAEGGVGSGDGASAVAGAGSAPVVEGAVALPAPPAAREPGGPQAADPFAQPGVPGGGRRVLIDPHTGHPQPQVLRVFKLKHREPDDMLGLLAGFFDRSQPKPGSGGAGYGPPGGGYGRPRADGGYGHGSEGAGYSLFSGGQSTTFLGGLRIATFRRSNSIVTRGSKEAIDRVADIVRAFDVAKDQPIGGLERVGNVRVVNFERSSANELEELIPRLGLDVQILEARNRGSDPGVITGGTLIISGPTADLAEVEELIKSLDTDGEQPNVDPAQPAEALRR